MHTNSTASAVAVVALAVLGLSFIVARGRSLATAIARLRQWEFWPAWLFYLPVVAMCLRLAVRYRGLALPTVANLNQKNGGMIGESKAEILEQLQQAAPEFVAHTRLIAPGALDARLHQVRQALAEGVLAFPFIFKPDVGQRGAGFRIIHDELQARQYLESVKAPVVMQQYAAGPGEAGIFYYRLPDEAQGKIFAITHKIFPGVKGDGVSTVAELIAADPRARLMAPVYERRLAGKTTEILAQGDRLQLVEAGNHCQGCIFEDGRQFYTEAMASRVDDISRRLEGFYIGRYDVRYGSEDDLRAGRFLVIELNGASSEATSIYDARNSLWQAYAVLYQQWDLVYRIGAMNRRRGHPPAGIRAVLRDWLEYRRDAAAYPLAD
jgi:hypothetical protein